MRHLSWAVLACAVFSATAFVACAKEQSQKDFIPTRDLPEAQALAIESRAFCLDSTDCHEAVAFMTMAMAQGVGMCTSFLIAPDVMATNSHCIPEDLMRPNSDCGGRIWALFPSSPGHPEYRASCAKVIFASSKSKVAEPDFAFIQLSQAVPGRKPIQVGRAGLKDNESFKVYKMNPNPSGAVVGSLEAVNCRSAQNSQLLSEFNHDEAPVATMNDCRIIHGNSGSPVLDADGKARAIIFAAFTPEILHDIMTERGFQVVTENDSGPTLINLATNLACTVLPSGLPDQPALPSSCSKTHGAYEERADLTKKYDIELKEMTVKAIPILSSPVRFGWRVKDVDDSVSMLKSWLDQKASWNGTTSSWSYAKPKKHLIMIPYCFDAPKKWIEEFKRPWTTLKRAYSDDEVVHEALAVWDVYYGEDPDLRAAVDLRKSPVLAPLSVEIRFDARSLEKSGRAKVKASALMDDLPADLNLETLVESVLPTCR
jgi:hypothetical protein